MAGRLMRPGVVLPTIDAVGSIPGRGMWRGGAGVGGEGKEKSNMGSDGSLTTVLVATVGTGRTRTDIAEAVAFSFRRNRADRAVLLCSEKSAAETLPHLLGLLPEGAAGQDVCPGGTENDVQALLMRWNGLWARWLEGLEGARVVVDYTAGTKAMSAAAFALAVARGADRVSYVTGPRDETGRVIRSTGVLSFAPDLVVAQRRLRLAVAHFNVGAYAAARDATAPYLKADATPDEDLRERMRGVHYIAAAYEAWDRFDWKRAAAAFHNVARKWGGWDWVRPGGQLDANYEVVRELKNGRTRRDFPTCLLADLLAGARRCAERGRCDDAVVRLYRACEMVAQKRLLEAHGVKTSGLDVSKLPEDLRDRYERRRGARGKVLLGLRDAYGLLRDLGDPLGEEFFGRYGETGRGELGSLLAARNQASLGHGVDPISSEKALPLEGHILELAGLYWKDELEQWLDRAAGVRLDAD